MALETLHILLVEDDPVFRSIVAEFLRSRGALVTEAADGQEGLNYFAQRRYDIVLADLNMPNLDGLAMLKKLYQSGCTIPSIILSGNQRMALVTEALRIGASDYLVKPISDLYMVEHAINQCLVSAELAQGQVRQDVEELSYLELSEHLALLEQNTAAALCVQQQLFPASTIDYPKVRVDFTLLTQQHVSPYFIDSAMVGARYLVMYMAHFYPEDNRAAFACVLLKSVVNQKIKELSKSVSNTVIEPVAMLKRFNERLLNSGMELSCDLLYVVIDLADKRFDVAQAGRGLRCYLRNQEGLTRLMLSDSMPLGLYQWGEPAFQSRDLVEQEVICLVTAKAEHTRMLLENRFSGLTYAEDIPEGGFIQMSLE